ncbi:Glu/Leu/Phe/Val family dehydrogenase [Bacillus kwashiorkori]|uniref:Glu/Leu/Phe/Val family dehydrogenase n=1 Tax=Bacillus kwashiorkori TaxID=1522318 RepID=UPI000786523E|nr:Glu/Leu/Phe/Val dehydrogenase [Bacillus kwashiorkori]
MDIFTKMNEYEQIMFCNDSASGLKAIIVIHNTTLGPALGGCRMRPYASVDEALEDALRLAKGMTYKCAAADVDFGGGKSVIIGDPQKDKSPELFRAFGQFIDSLNGRYYTGTDMGTELSDFVHAAKETNCIAGLPEEYGGGGDTSVPTAMGVIYGLKATSKMLWGSEDLADRTFSIQGLGKVGFKVAEQLIELGANLYVTDVNDNTLAKFIEKNNKYRNAIKFVHGNDIYSSAADIFVPCALGGIINDDTIEQLQVKAVVGSANNQLLEDRHADVLRQKNILYAPDYIVNAGGLIQVADELYGPNKARVLQKTSAIYHSLEEIYQEAEKLNISTAQAANNYCERKIAARKNRNSFFSRHKRPKWQIRN